jgi:hypothetical protein
MIAAFKEQPGFQAAWDKIFTQAQAAGDATKDTPISSVGECGDSATPTGTPTSTVPNTPAPTATVTPTPCGPLAWAFDTPYPLPIKAEVVVGLNGGIYSFGGATTGDILVGNSYRFDGQIWAPIAPLPQPRAYAAAVTDGTYIYILGGVGPPFVVTNTLYRYDPASNTYTTLAPAAFATYSSAAAYLNGRIYKIAGCPTIGCPSPIASVEVYDLVTQSWSTVANYPTADGILGAVSDAGFIYAAGGVDGTPIYFSKTYRYDPIAVSWDDVAIADMPVPREGFISGWYQGRWLIGGGGGPLGVPHVSVIAWDPAGNTWQDLPDMPVYRELAAGASLGAAFYAIGGLDTGGVLPQDSVERLSADPCAASSTHLP